MKNSLILFFILFLSAKLDAKSALPAPVKELTVRCLEANKPEQELVAGICAIHIPSYVNCGGV